MGSRHHYAYSTRHAILPFRVVCRLCYAGILHIGRTIRSGRMAQKIIIEESRPPLGGYQHNPDKDMANNLCIICCPTRCNLHIIIKFTDSTVPFWDSMTTALCIVAYWMLSRKFVEQWLVWLAVDAITVGLYIYKDIPLTAGLYALYCILAIAGYRRWRKMIRTQ